MKKKEKNGVKTEQEIINLVRQYQSALYEWLDKRTSLPFMALDHAASGDPSKIDTQMLRRIGKRATDLSRSYACLSRILTMLALTLDYDVEDEKEKKKKREEKKEEFRTMVAEALKDLGIIP